jgi:hypothetical protein
MIGRVIRDGTEAEVPEVAVEIASAIVVPQARYGEHSPRLLAGGCQDEHRHRQSMFGCREAIDM